MGLLGGITLGGKFGGWELINQPADKLPQDLASASVIFFGSRFEPIWILAKQIVNGTNYLLICEATRSTKTEEKRIVGLVLNIPPGISTGESAKVVEVIEDDELLEGTEPEDKVKEYLDSVLNPNGEQLAGVGIKYVLYAGRKITKGVNHVVFAQRNVIGTDSTPEAIVIEFNVFMEKASLYRLEPLKKAA